MQIGMRERLCQAAGPALSAGLVAATLTKDQLCEPQREPLFTHSGWPGQKNDLGQGALCYCLNQASPETRVPNQWRKGHWQKGKPVSRK